MIVETIKFGMMQIPDDKKSILNELDRCKNRFMESPTSYLQCRIDYLEERLDEIARGI